MAVDRLGGETVEDRRGGGATHPLPAADPFGTDPEWLALLAETEADDQARQAYSQFAGEVARRVLDWPTMRDELRHLGGGGVSRGDYSADRIPRSIYRRRGIAPDVAAADLAHLYGWEDTDAMLADVAHTYAAWRDGLKIEREARRILRETVKLERVREAQAAHDLRQFLRMFRQWFSPEVAPAGWRRFRGALVRVDAEGRIVQARRDLGAEVDGGVLRWRADDGRTPPAPKRGWVGTVRPPIPEAVKARKANDRYRARMAPMTAPTTATPRSRIRRLLAWLSTRRTH